MFYLLTGKVPGKSPNACPPLRTINPNLSDRIQYIVAKATQDDPSQRYDSADEMLGDLEHIGELSSEYKNRMRKRLILFLSCFFLSLIFLGVGIWGQIRIRDNNLQNFDHYFLEGTNYEFANKTQEAIDSYRKAIEFDPDNLTVYTRLYSVMSPNEEDEDYKQKKQEAIDYMCENFIDNPNSAMYQDPRLMYMIARECLTLDRSEPFYYRRASGYLQLIYDDKEYLENNSEDLTNLYQYRAIAEAMTKNVEDIDYNDLARILTELEDQTNREVLTPEAVLDNYYVLINIYCIYSSKLPNAYVKLESIGKKAKELIDRNEEYQNAIPLYRALAVGFCKGAINTRSGETAINLNLQALEWFEVMESLYPITDNDLLLDEADTCMALFDDLKDSSVDIGSADDMHYLDTAIDKYGKVLEKEPDNLMCIVKIGTAYVELANKTQKEEDIAKAKEFFSRWDSFIQAGSKNLSKTDSDKVGKYYNLYRDYHFNEE